MAIADRKFRTGTPEEINEAHVNVLAASMGLVRSFGIPFGEQDSYWRMIADLKDRRAGRESKIFPRLKDWESDKAPMPMPFQEAVAKVAIVASATARLSIEQRKNPRAHQRPSTLLMVADLRKMLPHRDDLDKAFNGRGDSVKDDKTWARDIESKWRPEVRRGEKLEGDAKLLAERMIPNARHAGADPQLYDEILLFAEARVRSPVRCGPAIDP